MSVQYPSLSDATQKARYKELAENTLYPYSYTFDIGFASTLYTINQATLGMNYFTFGFQADNNLSIAALEVQVSGNVTGGVAAVIGTTIFEISYAPVLSPQIFTATAPPAIPVAPTDNGNVIYRNFATTTIAPTATAANTSFSLDDFRRYEPNNYLLKFNQILYIHIGVGTALLNLTGNMNGSVIFHALTTGLKI